MATITKKTTTKAPAKKTAVRKTAVKQEDQEPAKAAVSTKAEGGAKLGTGKYTYATGRRKTAVANVRLFSGTGESMVNRKAFKEYFSEKPQQDTAMRPLAITGLMDEHYFIASINGGGRTSQVEALRHGIAQTLANLNDDIRMVLKKNGFLTRDDRKKERKKPGLRGARRSPQWAKR